MYEIIIWQDSKDPDRYHVGAKYLSGSINLWCTIYADGIADIFGQDVLNYANEGGEVMVEIKTRIVPQ